MSDKMSASDFRKMLAKKHKRSNPTANELTKEIIRYATLNGYVVWRNNTVGIFDKTRAANELSGLRLSAKDLKRRLSKFYRKSHDRKGAPDIIGYQKGSGRFIGIEVKVGQDKESPHQEAFRKQAEHSGALHIVARTLDDVIEKL